MVHLCFCACYEFGRGVYVPTNPGKTQRYAGDRICLAGQGSIQQMNAENNPLWTSYTSLLMQLALGLFTLEIRSWIRKRVKKIPTSGRSWILEEVDWLMNFTLNPQIVEFQWVLVMKQIACLKSWWNGGLWIHIASLTFVDLLVNCNMKLLLT